VPIFSEGTKENVSTVAAGVNSPSTISYPNQKEGRLPGPISSLLAIDAISKKETKLQNKWVFP
jgi:hypothetical protein